MQARTGTATAKVGFPVRSARLWLLPALIAVVLAGSVEGAGLLDMVNFLCTSQKGGALTVVSGTTKFFNAFDLDVATLVQQLPANDPARALLSEAY